MPVNGSELRLDSCSLLLLLLENFPSKSRLGMKNGAAVVVLSVRVVERGVLNSLFG